VFLPWEIEYYSFFLSTSLTTFAGSQLDFTLSDYCYQQPGVQDRHGVLYFPNEMVCISATSICVYKDAYGQYESKVIYLMGWKIWKNWSQNGELLEEKFYIGGETETIACLDFTQNIITLDNED